MVKVVTVTIVGYLIAHELVPRIDTYFARHHQIIFLFALSACFGLAALFAALDFTLELGALVAGVLLAASPYHREIATRLGGLRDFFLLMFFVVLGTQVSSSSLAGTLPAIIVFSGFILIGNPLIVILLMRRFGYTLETSFLASLTVSQISEFSLILLATGVTIGHLPETVLGPATVIALVTIFGSSYLIIHNQGIFNLLRPTLRALLGGDRESAPPPVRPYL